MRGSTIAKCFQDVSQIGIVTTKSISLKPRQGYREPVYSRVGSGSFINAVGLSNPGAEGFLEELSGIHIPDDKFLLISIFGSDISEFQRAAQILAPMADGFELNMSCPHASGYGIEIGQDRELCAAITRAVVSVTEVPVFVKLSTAIPQIGTTAKAIIEAGATGLTASNTLGPSTAFIGEKPILHNVSGGISGNSIRPLALAAVREIRQAVGPEPIILAMGGIGTAEHVLQFRSVGANLCGVGSALTGLDSKSVASFFDCLEEDLCTGESNIGSESPDAFSPMNYHRCHVLGTKFLAPDLYEIRLDFLPSGPNPGDLAGRYYFICIQGVGEKPFAVFSCRDKSIVVREVGPLTKRLGQLPKGTNILVRGPYGRMLRPLTNVNRYILAGGGTGIASLLEIAHQLRGHGELKFVLGARSKTHIIALEEFRALGSVTIMTDDGSLGCRGRITDGLRGILEELSASTSARSVLVNCGPDLMVEKCIALGRMYLPDSQILSAVEYPTSCGVGICGKCASPSGHLTCVDGPFLPAGAFDACGPVPKTNL